jgi:DNA-binding CsgD family transcriptional regulator
MRKGQWRRIAAYGAALAAGALALQWLKYDRLAWSRPGEIYFALVAAGFLALGVFLGLRLFAGRGTAAASDGNPQAVASLGISPRELAVLRELAAGRSNKEIARRLEVSPNTVKTHLARLYEKLGARRRTDAVNRARELGIIG